MNIFNLFDGSIEAGGSATVVAQKQDSFSTVRPENELLSTISSGSDRVDLMIDYSDFSNFVTFNSARSYVTITADTVLNSYPYDGTENDLRLFMDSLDGFQRFMLRSWPSFSGHLRLDPSQGFPFVRFADNGIVDGASKSSLISPGTGSMSINGWVDVPSLTGSSDVMVIFQKLKLNSTDGLTVFVSGSSISFSVSSGSFSSTVSAPVEGTNFFSATIDRQRRSQTLFLGSTGSFPSIASSASLELLGRLDLGPNNFFIGSGSISGKIVRPFSGSIDSVSAWSVETTVDSLSSSFNRKVFAQPGLIGAWSFDGSRPVIGTEIGAVVRDRSGHRLDGRISSFVPSLIASGSLSVVFDEPILDLSDQSVVDFITGYQLKGELFDRDNENLVSRMFPECFHNEVFENFSLILARHFDSLKTFIDQFTSLRRVDHSSNGQAPDQLLLEIGQFLGYDLRASFSSDDALRYFLGRNVIEGPAGNISPEVRMFQVKSAFWRRILQNIMHVYKFKGTKESVESFLRAHGISRDVLRLKEFSRNDRSPMVARWEDVQRTSVGLSLVSGSIIRRSFSPAHNVQQDGLSVEMRVTFPRPTDSFYPSFATGTIFNFEGSHPFKLGFRKNIGDSIGTLFLTSSSGQIESPQFEIFSGLPFNVSLRSGQSGSDVGILRYDVDNLVVSSFSTSSGSVGALPSSFSFSSGTIGSYDNVGSFIVDEFRIWDDRLTEDELVVHSRDPSNYGRDHFFQDQKLLLHWKMDDDVLSNQLGSFTVLDSSPNSLDGSCFDFPANVSSFERRIETNQRFVGMENDSQPKVRVHDSRTILDDERFRDDRNVSLEFNLIDSLNEMISRTLTSYDELNNIIGLPVNRFRSEYSDLRRYGENFFRRLTGKMNFDTFSQMLGFFDSNFMEMIARLVPTRSNFKADELIIESHMLERNKVQHQVRPIKEGTIEIMGSVSMIDRGSY